MNAISLTVNGRPVQATVSPRTHLADFLREHLLLTGTHLGCEHGICGACTVEINGEIARSCITYAIACDGADVRTIEGFDDDAVMAKLRAAFTAEHALQCGYCTPGMLIAARDLIRRKRTLSRPAIRIEMSGNLCRCTGYMGIVSAIERVMADSPQPAKPMDATAWLGPAPGPVVTNANVPTADPARSARPETRSNSGPDRNLRPAQAPPAVRVSVGHIEERDGVTRMGQNFVLDHPVDAVWALVSDVPRLASCMPGLVLDAAPTDDEVAGRLVVRVGPISASFAGRGRMRADPDAHFLHVEGHGTDRKGGSRVSGSVTCRLSPSSEARGGGSSGRTGVNLDFTYALTGPLAQIGRTEIARDLARRIGEAFAGNMEAQLRQPGASLHSAPLSGASIMLGIVRDRVRGWFRKTFRRPDRSEDRQGNL